MDAEREKFWDDFNDTDVLLATGFACQDLGYRSWWNPFAIRGTAAARRAFAEMCLYRFKGSLYMLEHGQGFEEAKQVREVWRHNAMVSLKEDLRAGKYADEEYGSIMVTILLFVAGQVIKYLISKWLDS